MMLLGHISPCMCAGHDITMHARAKYSDRQGRLGRIPILVEGERLRPNLTSLLELADYVSMSAKFPQVPAIFAPRQACFTCPSVRRQQRMKQAKSWQKPARHGRSSVSWLVSRQGNHSDEHRTCRSGREQRGWATPWS